MIIFKISCSCGAPVTAEALMSGIWRFRHGKAPEHILNITSKEIALARSDPSDPTEAIDYINQLVNEWVDSIHAFEQDGRWVGQPE